MYDALMGVYERLVLKRPWWVLVILAAVVALAASQTPKIKLDASADSLMLQGDPSLEYYREVSRDYSSEEFVLITWNPDAPLLSRESPLPLRPI